MLRQILLQFIQPLTNKRRPTNYLHQIISPPLIISWDTFTGRSELYTGEAR